MVTRLRAETVDAISAAKLANGERPTPPRQGQISDPGPEKRRAGGREKVALHLGVHEERLEVTLVVDQELLVAAREDVAGLLVAAVTDLGHRELALEPATDAVVDTLGLAPCLLDAVVAVRLVALLLEAGGNTPGTRWGQQSSLWWDLGGATGRAGATRNDARRAWSAS